VQQIDVMTGGLRWVRHNNPAVRTVAWSEIARCTLQHESPYPWRHTLTLVLRTGEQLWLSAFNLSDYHDFAGLVERGHAKKGLPATNLGAALPMAARWR
jgi:hypothetical protein